ncbi:hypothetical protein SprV_0902750500 [Sparganum proliferum]
MTPNDVFATSPAPTLTVSTPLSMFDASLPTIVAISIILATTSAATTTTIPSSTPATGRDAPNIPSTIILAITAPPNTSDEDSISTCPGCDRKFTSRIGLAGHLRIHRTETSEAVPGAPEYTVVTDRGEVGEKSKKEDETAIRGAVLPSSLFPVYLTDQNEDSNGVEKTTPVDVVPTPEPQQ